jgi:hypothetical protein
VEAIKEEWDDRLPAGLGFLLARVQGVRDLVLDVFGNPFRPAWPLGQARPAAAVAIALGAYEERDFSPARMSVLADALEEAGVTDEDVLRHCRGPAGHVRGCWVLDVLLGRCS